MAPSAIGMSSSTMTNGKRCWPSPSVSAQPPNKQQVNIPVQSSITPAPALTPSGTSSTTSPIALSLQSSPEGLRGRANTLDLPPPPLQLPESTIDVPPPKLHSAMSEALAASKSPGLMRRLSRGAANRLRRRQSSNHLQNRDRSSGPVMLRRRSNSKNENETENGYMDNEFEADIEDVQEDPEPLTQGLGLTINGLNLADGTSKLRPSLTQGGIAPIVPSILQSPGTLLTKITKRKRKDLRFMLNTDSGKVSWNPSNPAKQFYIDDIQHIRLQSDARNYREECQVPFEAESRWFTIIYADQNREKGRPVKTMHLLAPNQVIFELWTSTLDDLQRYRHELMTGVTGCSLNEKTLEGHWKREMAKLFIDRPHEESEERLDFAGVEELCHSFHIHCSKNMLLQQFEQANPSLDGYLNLQEFKSFIRRLKRRNEIESIYMTIAGDSHRGLSIEEFLQFLQHTQKIDVGANQSYWVKTFSKHVRKANKGHATPEDVEQPPKLMNLAAFSEFLCSDDNNIRNYKTPETRFDKPLNEYFVSSSHNTYLLGRQFAGSSSVEAYIRALQRGCRCVEIDCWDGPDGRPIVMHGRTMTSSVLFSDCISIIGKYAFDSSPYPLILSLEVHCNVVQQQTMVDIMISELGEQLVREPLTSETMQLPSPEQLRNRILIKVKAGDPQTVDPDTSVSRRDLVNGRRDRSFSSPWSRPQALDNVNALQEPQLSASLSKSPSEHTSSWAEGRDSMTATSVSSSSDDSEAGSHALRSRNYPKKRRRSKIIAVLGTLGVYTRGLKYNGFTSSESKLVNHIYSVGERTFERMCSSSDLKVQLEKHNMRHLMRVYPGTLRLHSSNPDPLIYWRRGVQMMALNWQTYDLPMQMNDAMFASGSDRFGYVLKPRELRESLSIQEEITEPSIHGLGKMQKKLIRFSVEIVSAQQLPRPRGIASDATIDPYVEIEMFCAEDKSKNIASGEGGQDASARNGMSGIGLPHRRRTRVVQANGFNPLFKDLFKLSLETKYPSLVFVRWTVWNNADRQASPLATFTAKLSSLEQGYRHLPLFDHNGDQFSCAGLFCKILKEDPVTIEREDPTPSQRGGFKRRFDKSAFKRTLSVEKRNEKQTEKQNGHKGPMSSEKSSEGC